MGRLLVVFVACLLAVSVDATALRSLRSQLSKKKGSLHHVLQGASATKGKSADQDKVSVLENQCASVLRDNFQMTNENTQVKSAVRWYKNNMKARSDGNNLFYLDDDDYITKTKCGMTSILLAALLGGVGNTPDTVLSHSWHLNEDVPADNTEFFDMFLNGRCTHSPGYYHDNIALHVLMRDVEDDNDDNFTHQFLLQKHGDHFYLWQSFISQYTLATWVQQGEGSSEFSGRMDHEKMSLFVRLMKNMVRPDSRAQAYRIFERLFYIHDKSFDNHMDEIPKWQFEKHCFPYDPSQCWPNWRKLEMFAQVVNENERRSAVASNSMEQVFSDIQHKLLDTNWNYIPS